MSVQLSYDIASVSGMGPTIAGKARHIGASPNESVWIIPDAFAKRAYDLKAEIDAIGGCRAWVLRFHTDDENIVRAMAVEGFTKDLTRIQQSISNILNKTRDKCAEAQKMQSANDVKTAIKKHKQSVHSLKKQLEAAEEAMIAFGLLGEVEELVNCIRIAVDCASDTGIWLSDGGVIQEASNG